MDRNFLHHASHVINNYTLPLAETTKMTTGSSLRINDLLHEQIYPCVVVIVFLISQNHNYKIVFSTLVEKQFFHQWKK